MEALNTGEFCASSSVQYPVAKMSSEAGAAVFTTELQTIETIKRKKPGIVWFLALVV